MDEWSFVGAITYLLKKDVIEISVMASGKKIRNKGMGLYLIEKIKAVAVK